MQNQITSKFCQRNKESLIKFIILCQNLNKINKNHEIHRLHLVFVKYQQIFTSHHCWEGVINILKVVFATFLLACFMSKRKHLRSKEIVFFSLL